MEKNYEKLPLRSGVGIAVLNKENKIDLVVIGPEVLLEEGLSDYLTSKRIM